MANTTHYSFQLPANFGSQNVWGTILNADLNAIDTAIWNASAGTAIGVNSAASGANIVLTNPLTSLQSMSLTATGKNVTLPAMNASNSLVVGGTVRVTNAGSNPFAIVAQDGATNVLTALNPGQTANITLLTNGTANGTFLVSVPLIATNNLSDVASPTTALNNLLPTQSGHANQFLTTNGTSTVSWAALPQSVLPGSVVIWTTNTAPSGYLECDGSAVSRTTFATLFAAIGTVWGPGNGSTTFNVPDMRGYFPRGWANAGSIDPGRGFATTQAQAFLSHTHVADVTDPGHAHSANIAVGDPASASALETRMTPGGSWSTSTNTTGISVTVEATGGAETRPINVAVMFIIKT